MNVYLDMDGVIVDFVGGCLKAHNRTDLTHEDIKDFCFYDAWGISEKDFWEPIQTKEFWEDLEWTPWGKELFSRLESYQRNGYIDRLEIVTRPNYKCPGSVTGKLSWIDKNIPGFERITFTRDKHLMAKTGILIDDSQKNYEEFVQAGGKAILVPQPWNINAPLVNDAQSGELRFGTMAGYVEFCLDNFLEPDIFVEPPDNEIMSEDSSTGGKKGVKLARYDLIPVDPLRLLAKQYGLGTQKYGDRNWEKGYAWSKSFASLNRHMWEFWNGEDIDKETNNLHIIAAAWHCFALAEFFIKGSGTDDRPRSVGKSFKVGGDSQKSG